MTKIFIFLSIFAALLVGCEKPNPHPETMDPIIADIEAEIKATESALNSAKKELEGFKLDEKKVQPQTGQNKYAQKRVYETQAKIDKIDQLLQYWRLRLESRTKEARKAYLIAYKKKEPWPDPNEYKEYAIQKKLRQAPLNWDVKRRMEEAGIGIPVKAPGSGGGHGGGEAQPASEHGGGHGEEAPAAGHGGGHE